MGWAVLGGRSDGPITRSHPTAPPVPSVVVQPHVNWGDYVVVDRVDGPDAPIVHDAPLDGYERVYVSDPFGNRIELMEPVPTV